MSTRLAVGDVVQPAEAQLAQAPQPRPTSSRRIWVGDGWHREVPVFAVDDLGSGVHVQGPAAVASAFTTVVIAPGDTATPTVAGDLIVELHR